MPAARNVLIVGGGPAGLSTGIVLGKRGIDAEIVELNANLRPLGSGLTMTGATLRALRAVDEEALDRCIEQGAGHDALVFGNAEGEIVNSVPMPPVAGPDKPGGFGIMRPLFWGLLATRRVPRGSKDPALDDR